MSPGHSGPPGSPASPPVPTGDAPSILVTAGPTHEPIDEVRFIGNRSSGRMGMAIAEAAAARGCPVTLLLGPVGTMPTEVGSSVRLERFRTTADLQAALGEHWPRHDVLVMAAAVADYRPRPEAAGAARDAGGKLRRTGDALHLELEPTPDLLAGAAAASRPDQTLVGFALEPSERLLASARDKLVRKGVHAIVANPLETMDHAGIAGTLVTPDGLRRPELERLPKPEFARWLVERVLELHADRTRPAAAAARPVAGPRHEGP